MVEPSGPARAAWAENGPLALVYLLAFVCYRGTLRLLRRNGEAREVNLLLRVFGQQKSQTSLARGLLLDYYFRDNSWRATVLTLMVRAARAGRHAGV